MPELAHSLGREPEQARYADQLRERLGFELPQLGELARLEELLQPGLDPGADAGQLADTTGTNKLGDVDGRRSDQLGGPAIGAHGVVARPGEVEQCRKGFESLGKGRVLHV